MRSHHLRSIALLSAALLGLVSDYAHGAKYKQPDASTEIFQLEKIPLQIHGMKDISNQLIILAQRSQNNSAAQHRASAQMLALAMRLNPASQQARQVDRQLTQGPPATASNLDQIIKAKSKIRFYKKWLSNPDAGQQANLLAKLLTDATKSLDPDTMDQGDTADWKNVIPTLADYTEPVEKPAEPVVPQNPVKKTDPKAVFHIKQLSIKTPLVTQTRQKYRDRENNDQRTRTVDKLAVTTVSMTISSRPNNPPNQPIKFSSKLSSQSLNTYLHNGLARENHPEITSSKATVTINLGTYATSNQTLINAPIAVMLESSLSNRPIRKDLHILATINTKGQLSQPTNFWKHLNILRQSTPGGRLIIAKKNADLVFQLLVYNEPEFFTRWEIFTATDLSQAMEAAVTVSPEKLAKAGELFAGIQKLTPKNDVTKLAVNHAVRKRLAEIITLCPNHLSSAALLLQGGGKRPIRLNNVALAYELLPILKSVDRNLGKGSREYPQKPEILKKVHTGLRTQLDPIETILDRSHKQLYEDTLKLVNDFRRLATVSRRLRSSDGNHNSLTRSSKTITDEMQNECDRLIEHMEKTIQSTK